MEFYQIPLTPDNQQFNIQLAELNLAFRIIYRDEAGWILDIRNNDTGFEVQGISLVSMINLIEPYPPLNAIGQLVLIPEVEGQDYADKNGLGITHKLYYLQESKDG